MNVQRIFDFDLEDPAAEVVPSVADMLPAAPLLFRAEVANGLGLGLAAVDGLCQSGRIVAVAINQSEDPAREHVRIFRESVIAHEGGATTLANSRRYTPRRIDLSFIPAKARLRVGEVAEILRASDRHVRNLVAAGTLAVLAAAGNDGDRERWSIDRTSLVDFLRRRSTV